MKELGGYFELELSQGNQYYHDTALQFQSGRSALYFILSNVRPNHIYLPFYTCDALLNPVISLGIPFTFYRIDVNLEIETLPTLDDNDLLLYINYYDIKRNYTERLSAKYKDRLIIDCSQSYFLKGNNLSWYFNSTRKFFGVPDGADLYTPAHWNLNFHYKLLDINSLYTTQHLVIRYKGSAQDGYKNYLVNEDLVGINYDKMSVLTRGLLSHIDYQRAMDKRIQNFKYIHKKLGGHNRLNIEFDQLSCPSYYPYLPGGLVERKQFWEKRIYIPSFWNDCLRRPAGEHFAWEKELSGRLLPIPVDHRYSPEDLNIIIEMINIINA